MAALPLLGAREPAQPLLTLLAPEGRVELSGATTANWVAKTANLLHATGGQRVGLLLPLHWQLATLLVGGLSAGWLVVVATSPADLAGCDVAFVGPEDAAAALGTCAGDVLAVSPLPLGGPVRDRPAMVLDAAAELRTYGDRLERPAPGLWRVEHDGRAYGPGALPDLGLGTADRVATSVDPRTETGLLTGLLTPLAAGAALVLVPDPTALAPGALAAEQVTATVGLDVPEARRLG